MGSISTTIGQEKDSPGSSVRDHGPVDCQRVHGRRGWLQRHADLLRSRAAPASRRNRSRIQDKASPPHRNPTQMRTPSRGPLQRAPVLRFRQRSGKQLVANARVRRAAPRSNPCARRRLASPPASSPGRRPFPACRRRNPRAAASESIRQNDAISRLQPRTTDAPPTTTASDGCLVFVTT